MKKQLPANYQKQNTYNLEDAVALLPQLSTSKFVGNVDIDILIDIPEKQAKETSLRGNVNFPHQFGEPKRVAVFANEQEQKAALKAGADQAGLDELIQKVEAGNIDFDVAIATPSVMPKIAKLGKILGPKGVMPNPNNETVTADLARVITNYKGGKQDFKMSEQKTIRCKVAKVSMSLEEMTENIITFLKAVYNEAKRIKPVPFRKITLSPTMGAGVKLDISDVMEHLAK